MLKLSDNPPILLPTVKSLHELVGTWWVAHTRSRFEKIFAWEMLARGIGYFLPMREKVVFSGRRKRHVMVPLFTSYVFFCGCERDRYSALTTNRLCQTIEVVDQDRLIAELTELEKAIRTNSIIDSYPHLPVGSRARVTCGPMMGTEGVIVERIDERARMVLEVSILGQGALIEVDADFLESVT